MARREKKSKINLKVWVPIICVIVVGVTFFMLHDIQKKIDKMEDYENLANTNENNTTNDVGNDPENQNFVEENTVQNEVANEVTNTATNNTVKNVSINQNNVTTEPGITDKKQKAIELVKKEWGADNSVDFVFDHVENDEYIIAVKDRSTATVKYYFRVNLETKTVEMD